MYHWDGVFGAGEGSLFKGAFPVDGLSSCFQFPAWIMAHLLLV